MSGTLRWNVSTHEFVFLDIFPEQLTLFDGANQQVSECVIEPQRFRVGDDRVVDALLWVVRVDDTNHLLPSPTVREERIWATSMASYRYVEFTRLAKKVGAVQNNDQVGEAGHKLDSLVVVGLHKVDVLHPAASNSARGDDAGAGK